MSLWVKVHTNFYTHRKTAKLRASLGDDAYWVPPRLWAYAVENQPDGDFSAYCAQEIANLIGYTKDADKMLQALLQACLMDSDPLRIHDWQEHGAIHVAFAEKAKKAANARWERSRQLKESNQRKETEKRGDEPSIASSIAPGSETPAPNQPYALTSPTLLVDWQLRKDIKETKDPVYREQLIAEQRRRSAQKVKPRKPTPAKQEPVMAALPIEEMRQQWDQAMKTGEN